MEPHLIFAPILTPDSGGGYSWYHDGALCTNAEGRIAFAGPRAGLPAVFAPLPSRTTGNIILPGFIDLHTHLAQYRRRGRYAEGLLPWLERHIYPEEIRFADAEYARGLATSFFGALARAGTTTAAVYTASSTTSTHIAFEEAERSGLRIFMGRMMMDHNAPRALLQSAPDIIRETEELIRAWHRKSPLLQYAVSPRFALACSFALLEAAGELAHTHGAYIQTHLNEQPEEIRRTMAAYPGFDSYTDIYQKAGLLTGRTILGHNVHAGDKELEMIAASGASVAHCPDANLFLGSGRFPIEQYEDRRVRFGLGSDVGAGTSLGMLRIMRSMAHAQGKALEPGIPLRAATLGGAEALGIGVETGSLEAGKWADYIELPVDEDALGARALADLTAEEAASLVVYGLPETAVVAAFIAGREAYRNNPGAAAF